MLHLWKKACEAERQGDVLLKLKLGWCVQGCCSRSSCKSDMSSDVKCNHRQEPPGNHLRKKVATAGEGQTLALVLSRINQLLMLAKQGPCKRGIS